MIIKVCGITTVEDGLAAAAAGADALGFNFYPGSPRYLSPEAAAAITAQLPSDVLKVGVFVDATAAEMEAIARAARLDVVQLHGAPQGTTTLRFWQAVAVRGPETIAALDGVAAEAVLLDTPSIEARGGTGQTWDWSLIDRVRQRIILAGGLGPDNVADAVQAVRPWGVDACSRLESALGRKDHEKVRRFVAAARSAT